MQGEIRRKVTIITIIASVVLYVCFAWCKWQRATSDRESIAMYVRSALDYSERICLVLENGTDSTIAYGDDYHLYREQNEDWVLLSGYENALYTLMSYSIYPGESRVCEIMLSWHHDTPLVSGNYKIVKIATVYEAGSHTDISLEAEFTVK
jgi:hypothetical protein